MTRGEIVALLTCGALAMTSGTSYANFGSETAKDGPPVTQVSLANDKNHRVDFMNTTTETGAAIKWALNDQFPRFDFTWTWVDGDDYDVRVMDDEYGDNNLLGWVNCPPRAIEHGTNPDRSCYGQVLKRNLSYPLPEEGRRYMACHELGHTVGLQHEFEIHSDSCMRLVRDDTPSYSQEDVNDVVTHY
jgi:hypothetical protein